MNCSTNITTTARGAVDWRSWLDRWDRQQEGYMADREERFGVVIDVIEATAGTAPVVLDLCCGPGSLSARLLDRLSAARVVALDADPVLQLIGQQSLGEHGGRLSWRRDDLADPGWEQRIAPHGPFDAVVSTTALHWLRGGTLADVYGALARLLRPGGVFVDGDHLFEHESRPRLRALGRALRRVPAGEREEYRPWWDALEEVATDDAALAAAFAERATEGTGHPETEHAPALEFHVAALRHAGFSEVGTVWQRGDDRVLVGLLDG